MAPRRPVAYAEHITAPVIIQFARGDKTVPNPTTSAILRAGDLADRATYFRNDLFIAAISPDLSVPREVVEELKNPHTFLTNLQFDASAPLAVAAQAQIAAFFASDGALTIDPDGAGPFFETPIVGALPETLSFIP